MLHGERLESGDHRQRVVLAQPHEAVLFVAHGLAVEAADMSRKCHRLYWPVYLGARSARRRLDATHWLGNSLTERTSQYEALEPVVRLLELPAVARPAGFGPDPST